MTESMDPTATQTGPPHEGMSLFRLAMVVLRGKRTILLTGLLFAVLGLLVGFVWKPEYTASTEILPPQQSPSMATAGIISQIGTGGGMSSLGGIASAVQAKSAADMYSLLLLARPSEEALVQRFGLEAAYHTKSPLQARLALSEHTIVTPLKEGLITIDVRDRDPERAAALANGYVEQLRTLMKGLALTGAAQRRIFFEQQVARTKDDVDHAEVAFKQMQQSNHMISVDAQARTLIEGAASLRAEVAAKEVELQGLKSYSTEANPQVQIAERELAALRGQQAQMDAQSQGSYSDVGLSSVPGAELDFVRASRELKYQEELYELLLKQYETARIDEAQDAPIVQVVESAIVPERKSSPKRTLIAIGALLFGLLVGVVRVIYRFWRAGLDPATSAELTEVRRAAFRW
jgi:tyrosine-protein kinase Etk/Wzc